MRCPTTAMLVAKQSMRRAALLFFVLFAMLSASLHPAEAAHLVNDEHNGAAHLAVGHDDVGTPDAETPDDSGGSDQNDDGLTHHHCPSAWVPDAGSAIAVMPLGNTLLANGVVAALRSRSDDPLLEPPSA